MFRAINSARKAVPVRPALNEKTSFMNPPEPLFGPAVKDLGFRFSVPGSVSVFIGIFGYWSGRDDLDEQGVDRLRPDERKGFFDRFTGKLEDEHLGMYGKQTFITSA